MERHISKDEIVLLFSYRATAAEVCDGVAHLLGCPICWDLAAGVVESLRATRGLVPTGRGRPPERFRDAREAVIVLMEAEEQRSVNLLRAKGWWAELKEMNLREQADKVNSVAAVHKREVFETIIQEAQLLCGRDPYAGEHLAMAAHMLVDHLPNVEFPARVKNGLRLTAMTVVANSRRLAANWEGSFAAISTATHYEIAGAQLNAQERAYLLSIHASLLSDTGRLESAAILVRQAAEIYRLARDTKGLARMKIQEADALQAASHPQEALALAEDALNLLTPDCVRLEMLARSIITESMVSLGRLSEALRSYEATKTLYHEVGEELTLLKAEYLEAKLLDALGHVRESEKLFRSAIEGFTEAELFRSALAAMFALFESLFKRGAFGKAARLCEEAIDLLKKTEGVHSQMSKVWRDLLEALQAQALTEAHLSRMRDYLVRHWTAPAPSTPFAKPN